MRQTSPDRDPLDTVVSRKFIEEVLCLYPDQELTSASGDAHVESISAEALTKIPNFETDRAYVTYGRWYGQIRVGTHTRWAFWAVDDDDESDSGADDRGRRAVVTDNEPDAARLYVDDLIALCDLDDRPAPEDWPHHDQERQWQLKRLEEYIGHRMVWWRALTGFPDEVIADCIRARIEPVEAFQTSRDGLTDEHLQGFRLLAALAAGAG